LAKQSEYSAQDQLNNHVEFVTDSKPIANGKKPFVEPEISAAVDVLEATTFLQFEESGATN
jgi:hypothetical protein